MRINRRRRRRPGLLYSASKWLRYGSAIQGGTIGKHIVRRQIRKAMGPRIGKMIATQRRIDKLFRSGKSFR